MYRTMLSSPRTAHLLTLLIELLLFNLEADGRLLLGGQLHQDVGIECLALADGRVQGNDDEGVRRVRLWQQEDADYGVILHPVVLRL